MQLTKAGVCCPCPAVLILYIGLRHGWWLKILRCCWSVINSTGGGGSINQSDSSKAKQQQGKARKCRGVDSDEDESGDEEVSCTCCADQAAFVTFMLKWRSQIGQDSICMHVIVTEHHCY